MGLGRTRFAATFWRKRIQCFGHAARIEEGVSVGPLIERYAVVFLPAGTDKFDACRFGFRIGQPVQHPSLLAEGQIRLVFEGKLQVVEGFTGAVAGRKRIANNPVDDKFQALQRLSLTSQNKNSGEALLLRRSKHGIT